MIHAILTMLPLYIAYIKWIILEVLNEIPFTL